MVRFIVIFIIISVGSGCSSKKVDLVDPVEAKFIVSPPTYAKGTNINVINECFMLEEVESSFLLYSRTYSLNSVLSKDITNISDDQFVIKMKFNDVTPNAFHPFSFRPISEAIISVSVMKNGEIVDEFSKKINSKWAFTACDRLEKIAKASGKYAAKWLNKRGY
ncbi:hypothetical protein MIB92_00010 [Aestuariirhabdus sp. Z084]|uniref:hypothetical protein n=1 Tax=Aestuariirhabdus haliotis TaxID=2918751 RepID=UPI00201B457A|nr:hypothetical protein [Aestuariirhabdus haliotis]MCL6414021.1 hypothetical protein [Aestuariirhabdus haliotis]MCL6417954.1 hypothetical protein [Aestuariirhabdus haliotis]